MNTIGKILKDARLKKGISQKKLGYLTKIKKEFIILLEQNNWDKLPEFPVVSGFVKNIASVLDLSPSQANAVLRRDYPPKKSIVNPVVNVEDRFSWTPKTTFTLAVGFLVITVLGYLGYEYFKFVKPPEILITRPKENEIIFSQFVKVEGKTTTDAILTVNNQPIIVDSDGNFSGELEITKDTKELKFVAISRSGKETVIVRKIETDSD